MREAFFVFTYMKYNQSFCKHNLFPNHYYEYS